MTDRETWTEREAEDRQRQSEGQDRERNLKMGRVGQQIGMRKQTHRQYRELIALFNMKKNIIYLYALSSCVPFCTFVFSPVPSLMHMHLTADQTAPFELFFAFCFFLLSGFSAIRPVTPHHTPRNRLCQIIHISISFTLTSSTTLLQCGVVM